MNNTVNKNTHLLLNDNLIDVDSPDFQEKVHQEMMSIKNKDEKELIHEEAVKRLTALKTAEARLNDYFSHYLNLLKEIEHITSVMELLSVYMQYATDPRFNGTKQLFAFMSILDLNLLSAEPSHATAGELIAEQITAETENDDKLNQVRKLHGLSSKEAEELTKSIRRKKEEEYYIPEDILSVYSSNFQRELSEKIDIWKKDKI